MAEIGLNGSRAQVNGYHAQHGDPPNSQSSTLSPQTLHEYLSRLLIITLGARREELEADGSLLSEDNTQDTIQRCSRFLQDSSSALYAQKIENDDPHDGFEKPRFRYNLSLDLPIGSHTVACVAILKRPQPIDLDRSLSEQLQIVNLPGLNTFDNASSQIGPTSSPYELLYSVVRSALAPYFDALAKSQDPASLTKAGTDTDQRIGIPGAKRKIAELELSLLQLQQNAEIPQLSLPLHPVIQSALDEAKSQGVPATLDFIPDSLSGDSQFHNSLQSLINGWIKSIQTITKTTRDPASGTAAQEINFWLDKESALESIEEKLKSQGVQLSIDVLKSAKRFMATFSFGADTGLRETTETVQRYNGLMRDFPLPDLLSATSLEKVQDALDNIFSHLSKKLRISPYPIRRALVLVEAISGDLDIRIHSLLNGRLLMQMGYGEFRDTMRKTTAIWRAWDDHVKDFTNAVREITRRRNEKYIPIKIAYRHLQTQDRLNYVTTFRTNHEQLQQMISTVLTSEIKRGHASRDASSEAATMIDDIGDFDAVEEVGQAYTALKGVDVLDVSPEGTMAWDRAESLYSERTSRVENSIIARLRDRLATAKTANEMFRVFSKFNALLVRPKIRGAISEYQTQLIENVKSDIASLQERFKQQYGHSQAHAMAQLHDLPPVSGAIIWARQIERQLDGYMRKVEDVLGNQWAMHADGQRLQTESDNFRKKLDTKVIYQTWLQDTNKRDISISGRLFNISRNRAAGNALELSVNFDGHIITLFKEVRNLLYLNFTIPNAISNASKEARRVYPYAVSLVETVRTFLQTSDAISRIPEVSLLLNGHLQEVQILIEKGIPLKWESLANAYDLHARQTLEDSTGDGSRVDSRHVQFIRDLASSVSTLESKTSTLASMYDSIQQHINRLRSCAYEFSAFQQELSSIQAIVDRLSLENFSNLGRWVSETNATIQEILLGRLVQALHAWREAFRDPQLSRSDSRPSSSDEQKTTPVVNDTPHLQLLTHEITMRNQSISLEPPLEFARSSLLSQLQEWVGHVCDQRQIQASRYELRVQRADHTATQFSDVLTQQDVRISSIYEMIDLKLSEVQEYVDRWLRFQSLWDLQFDYVFDALGDDLTKWLSLLHEIRQDRSTFESSQSKCQMGLLTINYEHVQQKINDKYDSWQNDILAKFCLKLGSHMSEVLTDMVSTRQQLEASTLESSSTIQAVTFITIVQTASGKVAVWEPQVDSFRQGQAALARQRSALPKDCPSVQHVEDEWTALNEILTRKRKAVEDQTDALRTKITAEDKALVLKIDAIKVEWNEERPVSGSIPPADASRVLSSFESKLTKLSKDFDLVSKAKEALDLPASSDAGLHTVLEELSDFKSVWANLATVWSRVDELREMSWSTVQPRKLRQSLEGLITTCKEMPTRMRQYAAYDYFQQQIQKLIRVNSIVSDLRSDAIRERHWTKIFKSLRPDKRYSQVSLMLGDVWDLKLAESDKIIRDVITQAQGETALEEYLRQVRETWQNYALDLVNYQNKCRLIRGWDELFAKCSDNLTSLQAMRHSPYYKEFEEEASSWEDRLNRVYVLFDVWIDVQRQWVYLEGVFTGNADIKHLLPMESSRFQNINSEFFAVMKKVHRSPFVLEVLSITGVQKSLDRLADLLNKIQKALGEYLERERSSFPRFYFVGDEDLLEIIGNSNDTARVARHLGKMFAGLSAVVMGDESTIVGFRSAQGEEVLLKGSISLVQIPRVNEWLAALEQNMRSTLAELLAEAVVAFPTIFQDESIDIETLMTYLESFPAQIAVLAGQAWWTASVEAALDHAEGSLESLHTLHITLLEHLAGLVIEDLEPILRKKCEQFVTEFVFQRDVIEKLRNNNVHSSSNYLWLLQMRYVYRADGDFIKRLQIRMANSCLDYGFEYLGVTERLVRTPLTDRCFLTMTQALCQRLGGSPYGPAGTGKTETVKALGLQLGRFTLVFCCDDTFDFQAMGRIFLGICQVGAWGCFDEFNRLEERILSAVSQQIQNIQLGLKRSTSEATAQIELVGRQLEVNPNTGIFITMNPGYAGRSNLPDNLKKLFRSVAMSKPDKELIAEVTLYSQGFSQARDLSKHVVPFFDACLARLSKQPHYDFGLRALKSVLVSSGGLKRLRMGDEASSSQPISESEPQIIVQSLHETISPKLIREDIEAMKGIEAESFPGVKYIPAALTSLSVALEKEALDRRLVYSDAWRMKAIQLFQIQQLHHGVMMVGASGSGKSSTWATLLKALEIIEGVEGMSYVIDPKVMSKEALYGTLDSTTREWSDGLFTGILRKIIDNLRGESTKRHWIIFDGDVDPEWVENLNSVLDDNKLLTLPNGERLVLPPNVRILFEVETLKFATLATVSRCGMVWFNEDNVSSRMIIDNFLDKLRHDAFEDLDEDSISAGPSEGKTLDIQRHVANIIGTQFATSKLMEQALEIVRGLDHIMEFTEIRALNTFFALINKACRSILEYNVQHSDFPLDSEQIEAFATKKALLALTWSLAGDCPLSQRQAFANQVASLTTIDIPEIGHEMSIIDYTVTLPEALWTAWQGQVPSIEVNTHSITQSDVVIPTLDTVRHEDILYAWLAEHKPLILCGPPGSGKTMTLFSALRKLPDMEVVGLNFSSATTPELLLRSFEQHCEYRKTLSGVVLSPPQIGRWIVIFCDEINLPAKDKYGTQRVIAFMRQLIEQNGFYRTSDGAWVSLDRIQFVGACNPPTDAGRVPLGLRFLRHAPVVMVDYPGKLSLQQIYGTFNNAVLKILPSLRGNASAVTDAMVQLYSESQARFTPQIQPHYIYSPRELTRWVRGLYEAIRPLEHLDLEGLVRIWAHEALRLFQDRLIGEDERVWTSDTVRRIAKEHFPTADHEKALAGPILFSSWLSKYYVPVDRDQLREYMKERLKTFCEEEVDVPLILYDDALDHVLRIDRVFRQRQGHVILIGVSGSGKTTLSRFVAWINGLKVFQVRVHGKYTADDFDEDLRGVLRRCGTKGEKICFIMDESNVLDSAFLERMNTLLANAEVPGLFEGDEFAALMTACREGAQRQGLLLDSQDELYRWFTEQISRNLHVVFTMNPPEEGLSSRAATSPALFNRCVLNWLGDWSDQTLFQVSKELTQSLDLDRPEFKAPETVQVAYRDLELPPSHRDIIVNAMVFVHHSLHGFNRRLQKQQGRVTYLTPRHFLDFVSQYIKLYNQKREDLEEQQRHLNVGLDKLRDTVEKVRDLRRSLAGKKSQLEEKDKEANEKLQKMIAEQQQAETSKAAALEVQTNLDKQEKAVAERREVVLNDLAQAEPAVLEAQKSVSNIKRQQLTEVRSMGNPPSGVRLALEAVCTLLGHRATDWKSIQAIVRKDDFIASIVNYDNEKQMTPNHRVRMRHEYLSSDDFTYEKVNRASKACGPLVQWVTAQVNYSEILDRVGPLRAEVDELEEEALETKANAKAIQERVKELEGSIATYKSEYASLINETQAIKNEMTKVQSKVDRSLHLLDSLGSERKRWEEGSKQFATQIETIVGDTLVGAAFIAYGGLYDQQYRKAMMEDWLHHLSLSGIKFKQHNPMTEYLSTADDRVQWQEHSLPIDDLCTENAIMLQNFNRYPLIIDPSGRIPSFLQQEHQSRRLTITSFLDDNFVKQVESALRFGNPILIQDAEYLDPILNNVLNREYQRTGGRVLIQLGKQEIDFSPTFSLFLSTRDPSATFAPDICSRTTLVNFTVTQSSLQTQSLNEVLKSERPDVDERRSNLIKMQGEFSVHLRRLEKRLLQALNESKGNILDDDAVVETLENVKKEVGTITAKVAETEGVMAEVDHITSEYQVVAESCSAIFAVLEQLRHVNHFYQFSLHFFTSIFESVLVEARKTSISIKNYKSRVDGIIKSLFVTAFRRTSLTLLQKDRMTLAMLLGQAAPYKIDKTLFDALMDDEASFKDLSSESEDAQATISQALSKPVIKDSFVGVSASAWDTFVKEPLAEKRIPGHSKDVSLDLQLQGLLVTKMFRADRLIPAAEQFVVNVFGQGLLEVSGDLNDLIDQVSSTTPIALGCSPGFDASFRVDNVVEQRQVRCANIAMGSNEGLGSADKAISEAAASGSWVFIKNVHLAMTWLQTLEKRLGSLKPHADFRLFLSMETNPKIPVNLLRMSRVIMCEQPAGIRANIKDSMFPFADRATKAPAERTRLYLLLSLLHGIIQERLRYAPTLGWSASWEFNDSDFDCSTFIIDTWINWAAADRSNISPSKIPWEMLSSLIITTYGGKIDNEGDYQRLEDLVHSLLVPGTYDERFDIVKAVTMDKSSSLDTEGQSFLLPSTTTFSDFKNWVNNLPEREPPSFLGLPADAEKLLLVEHGKEMVRNMKKVMQILDESEQIMAEAVADTS